MTRYTPQWLQSGSYSGAQDRALIGALWPNPASSGCQVLVGTGMTVYVNPGKVAVPASNGTGSVLCTSDAVEQVTLTAAPASGLNRWDVIICHPRGTDIDGGANNDFIFEAVAGNAVASPVVPATPAGTVALANIYVPGGSAAVVGANITDVRPFGLAVPGVAPPVGMHAGMYRNAAFNATNTATVLPYDTAEAGSYPGMVTLGAAARFNILVPGRYLFTAVTSFATTAGQGNSTGYLNLRKNGAGMATAGVHLIGGQWGAGPTSIRGIPCVAGDYLDVTYNINIAGPVTMQGGGGTTFATLDFLGA